MIKKDKEDFEKYNSCRFGGKEFIDNKVRSLSLSRSLQRASS